MSWENEGICLMVLEAALAGACTVGAVLLPGVVVQVVLGALAGINLALFLFVFVVLVRERR